MVNNGHQNYGPVIGLGKGFPPPPAPYPIQKGGKGKDIGGNYIIGGNDIIGGKDVIGGKVKSAGWLAGYAKGYNDLSEEMRNEVAMKERRRQGWIPCPLCGQQKKRGGMRQHTWDVHQLDHPDFQ